MEFITIRCIACGAPNKLTESNASFDCLYCGTTHELKDSRGHSTELSSITQNQFMVALARESRNFQLERRKKFLQKELLELRQSREEELREFNSKSERRAKTAAESAKGGLAIGCSGLIVWIAGAALIIYFFFFTSSNAFENSCLTLMSAGLIGFLLLSKYNERHGMEQRKIRSKIMSERKGDKEALLKRYDASIEEIEAKLSSLEEEMSEILQ